MMKLPWVFAVLFLSSYALRWTAGQNISYPEVSRCQKMPNKQQPYSYKAYLEKMNWSEAKRFCEDKNYGSPIDSALAMPKSPCDQAHINDVIRKKTGYEDVQYWIGVNDLVTTFEWMFVDGTPVENPFFKKGRPNNFGIQRCVKSNLPEVQTYGGPWNNKECDNKYAVICQLGAIPGSSNSLENAWTTKVIIMCSMLAAISVFFQH